jgi:class 3 adenylate cyclase
VERRLTAVFAADMVGYSRLVRKDEAGTIAAMRQFLVDLFEPHISDYGGRIVKRMGMDSLLNLVVLWTLYPAARESSKELQPGTLFSQQTRRYCSELV